MKTRSIPIFAATVLACSPLCAETLSWPQFRGPNGNGIADADNVPTKWSAGDGVKWRTPLSGKGWSSPVVADGKIWITSAVEVKPTEEEAKKNHG